MYNRDTYIATLI